MPFRFLDLPPEIREHVYRQLLSSDLVKQYTADDHPHYSFDFAILRCNRLIHREAKKIFQDNIFVRISTPWREAEKHVSLEGRVPLLATGSKAASFKHYHLAATLDTEDYHDHRIAANHFIICVADLKGFCKMWFYSDLGHSGLNGHLKLRLHIRNPHEDRKLPKAVQQSLLLPFGMIKKLPSVEVEGVKLLESVEKELRATMAIPNPTAQECLDEATRLKNEGNVELNAGRFRNSIKLYEQAFMAMHIIVEGRKRIIMADAYFDIVMKGGPNNGQRGELVRLILRVRLVANTVLAFLKLEEFEEAKYWGMRTINLVREWTEYAEAPMQNFPARNEMGKIFYRTALATRALGDLKECRDLLKSALAYSPFDKIIQKECQSMEV